MLLSRLAARRRPLGLPLPRGAAASTAAAAAGRAEPASGSVLPDTLDRNSDAYARNAAAVGELLSDLRARVSQVLRGGGAEAVRRNAARGKLLPRDRIDRLLDPGASFLELSQHFFCGSELSLLGWQILDHPFRTDRSCRLQ